MSLNESIVEDAALEWFGVLCCQIGHWPGLAAAEPSAELYSFGVVRLWERLLVTIRRSSSCTLFPLATLHYWRLPSLSGVKSECSTNNPT